MHLYLEIGNLIPQNKTLCKQPHGKAQWWHNCDLRTILVSWGSREELMGEATHSYALEENMQYDA